MLGIEIGIKYGVCIHGSENWKVFVKLDTVMYVFQVRLRVFVDIKIYEFDMNSKVRSEMEVISRSLCLVEI